MVLYCRFTGDGKQTRPIRLRMSTKPAIGDDCVSRADLSSGHSHESCTIFFWFSASAAILGTESAGPATGSGEATVGEKLAQQYQQGQTKAGAQQTAFERRQRRRQEFYERESSRDDSTFFIISALVFLLPAVAILAVAYFTGYLDRVSDTYTITK